MGGLGKQEPLSLAAIMCACVCVCVFICGRVSARFVSCPLRLNVGKRPSGVVMADQAWRWRLHAAVGETGQMSGQDLRYRSAH